MKSMALLLLAFSISLSAHSKEICLDQNGVARIDSGKKVKKCTGPLALLNFYEAQNACLPTRLLKVYEVAQIIEAKGAKGILKNQDGSAVTTAQVKEGLVKVPAEFSLISAINTDGTKDEFYFSNQGYVADPNLELGLNVVWTSSIMANESQEYGVPFPYTLIATKGDIGWNSRNYPARAICLTK